jgi:hypothetical protein
MPKADTVDLSQAGVLYAQPIVNGFQLVNSTPKVVMKCLKHLVLSYCHEVNPCLISNQWFLYYQNDKLISEKIEVKF